MSRVRYQIQVCGEWAGCVGGWRPAVDGTINSTGLNAAEASTFESYDQALDALYDDNVIGADHVESTGCTDTDTWCREDDLHEDNDGRFPIFRIIEVQS